MHYICVVSFWLVDWLVGCNTVLTAMLLRPLKMVKSLKLKCPETSNVNIIEMSPKQHLLGINYDEYNDDYDIGDDNDDDDDDDDDQGAFS